MKDYRKNILNSSYFVFFAMNVRKVSVLSIFVACAFAVNYIESFVHLPIPCIHLGFANIFPLAALMLFGGKEAVLVAFTRLVLSYLLTGNVLAFSCSLSGTVCSLLIEYIFFVWLKMTSPVLLSLVGAFCFNLGQLVVMYFLLTSAKIFLIAPAIFLIGIVTGIAVGLFTGKVLKICRRL